LPLSCKGLPRNGKIGSRISSISTAGKFWKFQGVKEFKVGGTLPPVRTFEDIEKTGCKKEG
jgi:hypothetical protein